MILNSDEKAHLSEKGDWLLTKRLRISNVAVKYLYETREKKFTSSKAALQKTNFIAKMVALEVHP